MAFPSGFINASAVAFPCGHNGVCLIPNDFMYDVNSSPKNGGPLSDLTSSGIPCLANIASSLGMVALAEVFVTCSTSGYREYVSITTKRYWS